MSVRKRSPIEAAFRALPSASLDERIAVLRMLVEHWFGPIEPGDGYAARDLGSEAMPRALQRWLTTVGGKRVFSQNRQRGRPLDVRENGMLVFLVENQGCFELATPVDGEDPSVWSLLAVELVLSAPGSASSAGEASAEGDGSQSTSSKRRYPV